MHSYQPDSSPPSGVSGYGSTRVLSEPQGQGYQMHAQ